MDTYIANMEENIKLLKKQIKKLGETAKAKGFSHDNSREKAKGYLLAEYLEAKKRKIIPMPGIEATFCYDFLNNISTWYGPMQFIYGWNERYL